MKILILFLTFLIVCNLNAKEVLGVKFPENKTIDKTKLVLNGIGIRKATIFSVKVYVGALYMAKKSKDAKEFLNTDTPKYIEMHFVRDVGKNKMIGGWIEAFENALSDNLKPYKKEIDKFNSYMEDMKEKDSMILTFTNKGVKSVVKGKERPFIASKAFSKALLSVWFINAADEGLRDGLLGL